MLIVRSLFLQHSLYISFARLSPKFAGKKTVCTVYVALMLVVDMFHTFTEFAIMDTRRLQKSDHNHMMI